MRFIASLWRFATAALCFMGISEAWSIPNRWAYFTFQTGFALGVIMAWAGAASLLRGIQPPAWLKGCITLYAVVTALVAFLLMPPDNPQFVPQFFGIMTNTMLHRIAPIMAVVDFLIFDQHRRFKWHFVFSWLSYFPIYLAFILVRAQLWPSSGPSAGGNPYPYTFIDLRALGVPQFGINVFELCIAFFALSLIIFLIDRILPKQVLAA